MSVSFTDQPSLAGAAQPVQRVRANSFVPKQPSFRRPTGIGPLAEADRPAVQAHYLRLSREDRALRFASPKGDRLLGAFTDSMALDGSLGLFLNDELVGVAHLPHVSTEEVELGISIEPQARSCGWGHTLLSASLESVHASGNKGLTAHYSATNHPMVRLLRAMPRQAKQIGPDVCARVDLDDWAVEAHASNLLIEAEA